jgi:drug/metabolite transporter (DMT)-like permease
MSAFALALVLTAAVAHAAWNILAHGVSKNGMTFLWWGALFSVLLWTPVVVFTGGIGTDDWAGFVLGIGVAGVLHVVYMLVLQRGYASGSLSTVYATARGTGPLLSGIAAVLLLGERPGPLGLVGAAAIIAGVIAIGLADREKPLPGTARRIDPALVFGLLTGVAIAAYTIWDANAVRTWSISPVAFMVGCALVEVVLYTVILGQGLRELPSALRAQWPRFLAFGVLSPLSYILVLTAITIAPVALVAPMREVSVVIVSLFGVLVLKEGKGAWRFAASVVVVAGIVLLAV